MSRVFEVTSVFDKFDTSWGKFVLEAFITKLSRNCTFRLISMFSLISMVCGAKKIPWLCSTIFLKHCNKACFTYQRSFHRCFANSVGQNNKLNANRESWKHEKFLHNRDQNDAVIRTTEVRKTGYEKIATFLREGWVGGGKTHFFFLFCLISDIWLATKEKNLKQTRVKKRRGNGFPPLMTLLITVRLSPCGHPAITDTPIIRTADKFRAKINYRHLTEINSRYYGLLLQRTLT